MLYSDREWIWATRCQHSTLGLQKMHYSDCLILLKGNQPKKGEQLYSPRVIVSVPQTAFEGSGFPPAG